MFLFLFFYDAEIDCAPFIRIIIEYVENDPNVEFCFNWSTLNEFANNIATAVRNYYGLADISLYLESEENILEDNDLYGEWNNKYRDYRCYSYVMGYEQYYEPGQILAVNYGRDPNLVEYDYYSADISQIAEWVQLDIESEGYQVTDNSDVMPELDNSAHESLICVRKGTGAVRDYHFMILGNNGVWYHKPGASNPLRYKYASVDGKDWVSEGYFGDTGKYFRYPNIVYDSDIYYIRFLTPHSFRIENKNSGTHSKTCIICEQTTIINCTYTYTATSSLHHQGTCIHCGYTTPNRACTYEYVSQGNGRHWANCIYCDNSLDMACSLTYTAADNGQHYAVCADCNYSALLDCDAVTTYCGDNSTSHVHSTGCGKCGAILGSETEACTFEYVFVGTIDGANYHASVCTECDHKKGENSPCMYLKTDYCTLCGTHKDIVQAAAVDDMHTLE